MISHILAIIFISLVISGILFYGEDEELKVESLFSLPREMSEHSTYYVCFPFWFHRLRNCTAALRSKSNTFSFAKRKTLLKDMTCFMLFSVVRCAYRCVLKGEMDMGSVSGIAKVCTRPSGPYVQRRLILVLVALSN